jgi:Uncharacterized conserved protein (COG2071)
MQLTDVQGVIRRRILVNFRADPEIVQQQLPAPFKPKLHKGMAVVGICLIRLEQIRPQLLSAPLGLSSENAAHRIAVTWDDENGNTKEGVYIPRRDTSSMVSHLAGGRLFPGELQKANFSVQDQAGQIQFAMQSEDHRVEVRLQAHETDNLPVTSGFDSIEEVSDFFKAGSIGYSATKAGKRLDGMELDTDFWLVKPLEVDQIYSSYFSDPQRFPAESVHLDCALIMRDIPHRWHGQPEICLTISS